MTGSWARRARSGGQCAHTASMTRGMFVSECDIRPVVYRIGLTGRSGELDGISGRRRLKGRRWRAELDGAEVRRGGQIDQLIRGLATRGHGDVAASDADLTREEAIDAQTSRRRTVGDDQLRSDLGVSQDHHRRGRHDRGDVDVGRGRVGPTGPEHDEWQVHGGSLGDGYIGHVEAIYHV